MANGRPRAMTSGGLIKTSVQFRPSQLAALDEMAAAEHSDRASVARKLFDLGLEAYQRQQRILRAIEPPAEEAS